MDPLSQAGIGAAAASLAARKGGLRRALVVGIVAGAAPDLDVLIRSDEDPLLGLQYHRHFTHAIAFAPVIGLVVAGLFRGIFKWPLREVLLPAVLAALSHGLLDACTSYGTLLYLPFSNYRESWDVISIIDPLFTLPLVVALLFSFILKRVRFAQLGLVWCLAYLFFGYSQRERAEAFALELAESRGLVAETVTARPSIANLMLWRIVVKSRGRYFVDAVNLVPSRRPTLYSGTTVPVLDLSSFESEQTVLAKDVARFDHFSQSYLYEVPGKLNVLGDLRYSAFPDSIEPLWGIEYDPNQTGQHVSMVYFRDLSEGSFQRLWRMIQGKPVDE
ncbi:MAG: metal-dependent hydrolase [Verrucomicrobiota bacterium]